ncbi:AAEL006142-PA [Aedes aegypti]|uniref:BLOC-2 complex member HPS5 homolog n=1 Tax=Aedes aegypti TaxID=7159 RepID=HPS5_AEDAE|nr:RecName: Full=BLOC-2 complex member HPS5 homolog; AltName: Full=Hermansky-Pudlak syndrome 5 protein homolog; AltName: Full=Protein pink [Aedes aegypti]EAT42313.1 AAEL006142-PA [Aedes aegypti]
MIMDALRHYGLSQQRTELTSAIQLPLRNTRRIKFTCFDVSEKYIIFGANSGSLYVYDRESVNFLSIIPSQLGTISQVQISSNGKQIAVANMRGAIGVVLDLDGSASKEVLLTELGGGEAAGGVGVVGRSGTTAFVTSFCWGEDDKELYCGDSKGTVSLLQLSMFMGRNILNMTLSPVLLLENHIVQIDRYKELLLVSTLSKCVLCNTQREEFKQIGNRPRDGLYGATFIVPNPEYFNTPTEEDLEDAKSMEGSDDNDNDQRSSPSGVKIAQDQVRIFCSRPGSRLWEADIDGNVLRTHQFRHRSTDREANGPCNEIIAFKLLQKVLGRLILVHDDREIFLIDPIASQVVLWINNVGDISRVRLVGEDIYVFGNDQTMMKLRLDVEQKEVPKRLPKKINGKKSSPFKENGVYILDHLFNNNGLKEGTLQTESTIKEALASVVRGKYGRNIKQMFLGYDQMGPERPKTLNISKVYNSEESYNNMVQVLPTDESSYAEDDCSEDVVPKRNPPKKMFSMSLLSDYQLSEDDKTVRNLYLVYRSSIISNLNFADRYAKIFDAYDTESIVSLLHKLEIVMDENNEEQSRLKCIKIYFDYLKVELIWEIDVESRAFIKQCFIEYNKMLLHEELCELEKCESCGHYLRTNINCHYPEIGTTLIQYYWSRKDYAHCFELVQQIPFLWHTITKFYIQDNREDKAIQCIWNVGDPGLLERAACEMFTMDHWRQLLDLMLTCYNSNSLMCLNCDKLCTLADPGRNPMWREQQNQAQSPVVNPKDNNHINNNNIGITTRGSTNVNRFYSWNYILNTAIDQKCVDGKSMLKLLRGYDEYIPKGAISTSFYLKCLLNVSD